MSRARPEAGQVISYAYLWRSEYKAGRDEGVKDRPCAVVLVVAAKDGRDIAVALPITHSPPQDPDDAIEIPADTKRRLGLDHERSWIVLSEANRFGWPGPDVRPLHRGADASFIYGRLPLAFFEIVKRRFVEGLRKHGAAVVSRSD